MVNGAVSDSLTFYYPVEMKLLMVTYGTCILITLTGPLLGDLVDNIESSSLNCSVIIVSLVSKFIASSIVLNLLLITLGVFLL